MSQQWLTIAGLALDFTGFCLLLREWWLAFYHDSVELSAEERRAREASLRHFHQSNLPQGLKGHAENAARLQDEMRDRSARSVAAATLAKRRSAFILASLLIVIGFLLQIAGAVPGCCPPWITPQP